MSKPRPPRPGSISPVVAAAESPFRHRNLPLLLLQAREGVMARFRPILNAHGVTEQQWRILRALLEGGPMEPRQIGQVCRISSPSLAGVLARMDDLGLVQRARLPQDQRRVMVALTDRSTALAAAMAPEIEAAYAAIEAHIGGAFITRFYGALDELIGLLDDLDAADDA
jgi:homoprotocatechuate degradation regulator HpaR